MSLTFREVWDQEKAFLKVVDLVKEFTGLDWEIKKYEPPGWENRSYYQARSSEIEEDGVTATGLLFHNTDHQEASFCFQGGGFQSFYGLEKRLSLGHFSNGEFRTEGEYLEFVAWSISKHFQDSLPKVREKLQEVAETARRRKRRLDYLANFAKSAADELGWEAEGLTGNESWAVRDPDTDLSFTLSSYVEGEVSLDTSVEVEDISLKNAVDLMRGVAAAVSIVEEKLDEE